MRLAFVTPRFGDQIVGGAETLARDYATRLAARGHEVQVLTTCAQDLHTWTNYFRAGTEMDHGVRVRRFPVTKPKDSHVVGRIQRVLDSGLRISPASEAEWVTNNGLSEGLFESIDRTASEVDAIIFTPYLFANTVLGARVRPAQSLVIPCLHDEPYARFSIVLDTLRRCRGLIFNSAPERDLAQRLLGSLPPHDVVGAGFDDTVSVNGATFRHQLGMAGDLIAYAGRRERGKNFPLLVEYVTLYGRVFDTGSPVTLLAMGSDPIVVPSVAKSFVVDLGFVEAHRKLDAISASVATVQLSTNESFSYLIHEGWMCGAPAIVHADCAVTRQACEESGGGLWINSSEEFAETLRRLRDDKVLRGRLGRAGRAWTMSRYAWPAVITRLEQALRRIIA
jgi:glycosyltransferase involved in cell wall biosynthesis